MVKNISKVLIYGLTSLLIVSPVSAADSSDYTKQADINVVLEEVLTVTVSGDKDKVSDSGDTLVSGDIFLKDSVQLHIQTNNASGFSATMTTKTTDTNLRNLSDPNITIPTLTSNVTSEASFPINKWGFSLNGSNATTAVYHPLIAFGSAHPSVIAKSDTVSDALVDIYFGTKGNSSTTSGTYANAVVINVTTPPTTDDPIVDPVEPVNPTDPQENTPKSPSNNIASTDTPETEPQNPQPSEGYEEPQGVSEDTTTQVNIAESNLGISLAVSTTATIASGIIFFVLAKRKDDEDDEEEDEEDSDDE